MVVLVALQAMAASVPNPPQWADRDLDALQKLAIERIGAQASSVSVRFEDDLVLHWQVRCCEGAILPAELANDPNPVFRARQRIADWSRATAEALCEISTSYMTEQARNDSFNARTDVVVFVAAEFDTYEDEILAERTKDLSEDEAGVVRALLPRSWTTWRGRRLVRELGPADHIPGWQPSRAAEALFDEYSMRSLCQIDAADEPPIFQARIEQVCGDSSRIRGRVVLTNKSKTPATVLSDWSGLARVALPLGDSIVAGPKGHPMQPNATKRIVYKSVAPGEEIAVPFALWRTGIAELGVTGLTAVVSFDAAFQEFGVAGVPDVPVATVESGLSF